MKTKHPYYVYRILADNEELHRAIAKGKGMYTPIYRAKAGMKTELYDRIRNALEQGKEVIAERLATFEDYDQARKNINIQPLGVVPTFTRSGQFYYRQRKRFIKSRSL